MDKNQSIIQQKKSQEKLTIKRLKDVLDYNPGTGFFIWKVYRGRNARKGSIAGHVNNADGYRRIIVFQKIYKSSRLAWFYMEGYWPENDIDHRDRNRSNDKWDNLFHVSRSCNLRNKQISHQNKTGIKGVFWDQSRGKYLVHISINKKTIFVGRFKNLNDAAIARLNAEKEYGLLTCETTSTAYLHLKERKALC